MKRRALLIVLLLAVLGWAAWLQLRGPREPIYQAHRLIYWLEKCGWDEDETSPSRIEAQAALRAIGTNAIPTLLRLTRAHDSALKLKLLGLLEKQHLIPRYVYVIRLSAESQHRLARNGFVQLGAAASNAVPALIEIYDAHVSDSSQNTAARELGSIGPAARAAGPSLVRGLASSNRDVVDSSIVALLMIHAEPQLVIPTLIKIQIPLRWDQTTSGARDVLVQYGASAVPTLTNLLRDPDPAVRIQAAMSLGDLGSAASNAVPALIEMCDANYSPTSRRAAVNAFWMMGPLAKLAIPSLLRILGDTNNGDRPNSAIALGAIHAEPQIVVPALMQYLSELSSLSDPSGDARGFALEALGEYGPDAAPALPLVTNLLQDPVPTVRARATNALERIDPAAAARPNLK